MQKSLLPVVSAVVGTTLIIIGLLLALVIVPGMKRFPDDVDITREFDVNYLTLLDQSLFEEVDAEDAPDDSDAEVDTSEADPDDPCSTVGDIFFVFEADHGCPVQINRHVTVEANEGDNALVREAQTIVNGEAALAGVTYHYAVNRRSLEALERGQFPRDWSENEGYFNREGLVFGWGVDAEGRDYTGWADDYLDTVVLEYQEDTEHAGMDALYFTSSSEPGEIDDDYVELLGLPTEITVDQLATIAEGLDIDPIIKIALPAMLESAVRETQELEDDEEAMIPLVYAYDYTGQYWVEPETGVLLNTIKYEHRTVTFPDEIMDNLRTTLEGIGRDPAALDDLLPLTVSEYEYTFKPQSVEDAKKDAKDAIDQINLYGSTVPIVLIVIGVILEIATFGLLRTSSKESA